MRISDWSSDVCSSDLKYKQLRERGAFGRGNMRYHFVSAVSSAAIAAAAMTFATSAFAQDGDAGSMATGQPLALQGAADRKSVVLGKSVSVRVDLGGRRISKKKTEK